MPSKPGMERRPIEAHPNQTDFLAEPPRFRRIRQLGDPYVATAWDVCYAWVGEDGITNREAYDRLAPYMPYDSVTAASSYLNKAGFLPSVAEKTGSDTGRKRQARTPRREVAGRVMSDILTDPDFPWSEE